MNRILLLIEEQQTCYLLIQQLRQYYEIVTGESNPVAMGAAEVHRDWNGLDLCIGDRLGLESYQGSSESGNLWQDRHFPLLLVIHPGEWGILSSHQEAEEGANLENPLEFKRYDDAIAVPIQPEELLWRVEKLLSSRVRVTPTEYLSIGAVFPPEHPEFAIARRPDLQRHQQQNDQLLRAFVEEIRDYAIFLLDSTGRIASWNRGAQRLLGYSSSEIIGHHFSCFYPPEDIATGKPQQELQLVATAGQCEDEGWRRRRNGTRFWANITLSALQDTQGQLVGFSVIAHDLSDRKAVEMELCSLNRALTTIWECNQV
ncbi:MAG TPA: PAS domain S-box protein, partial [Vampirovibrionales bacterium]